MAVRSAISTGFPSPNFVAELGTHDAALPGEFIVENGQAVVAVTSGQIGNLTLSATAKVLVSSVLAATIGNISISATAAAENNFALQEAIADLTLAATAQGIVSAELGATIGELTLTATGHVPHADGGVASLRFPWWWPAYVDRILAERAAEREKNTRTAVLVAEIPAPYARARGNHSMPAGGLAAVVPAPSAAGRLTAFHLVAVIDHKSPVDDETAALFASLVLAA
jgi:hypothetical protein